jgi:hypothetical protein
MHTPTIKTLYYLIPVAVGLTLVMASNYMNNQQILRLSANEPQGYMADAVMARLATGLLPEKAAEGDTVAIESSSAPYVVIYDSYGHPVAGTGLLHGSLPQIPLGIFDLARTQPNRLTWQPEPGVRQAIVVKPASGGFVMAGRSLQYVEHQENSLLLRAAIGWLITMAGLVFASILLQLYLSRRKR